MPIVDHTNVEWDSVKAMARGWGVPYQTVQSRLDSGMSVAEALEPELTDSEKAEHEQRAAEAAAKYGDQAAEAESQSVEAAMRTMKPGQTLKDRFKGKEAEGILGTYGDVQ